MHDATDAFGLFFNLPNQRVKSGALGLQIGSDAREGSEYGSMEHPFDMK